MEIILASASPRRQELLQKILTNFQIIPADIDETAVGAGVAPMDLARTLSYHKAKALLETHPHALIIGCDTIVTIDNQILGKPASPEHSTQMLTLLSGRTHKVITGVTILTSEKQLSFDSITDVEFYPLTEKEISDYVATGEPKDKAGAYGIQGGASLFIKEIRGDYYGVMGLPVAQLYQKLKEFGVTKHE